MAYKWGEIWSLISYLYNGYQTQERQYWDKDWSSTGSKQRRRVKSKATLVERLRKPGHAVAGDSVDYEAIEEQLQILGWVINLYITSTRIVSDFFWLYYHFIN